MAYLENNNYFFHLFIITSTRSIASKSCSRLIMTFALFFDSCKARIAYSLKILTNSAPEKPNVCSAISDDFIFGDKFLF